MVRRQSEVNLEVRKFKLDTETEGIIWEYEKRCKR